MSESTDAELVFQEAAIKHARSQLDKTEEALGRGSKEVA